MQPLESQSIHAALHNLLSIHLRKPALGYLNCKFTIGATGTQFTHRSSHLPIKFACFQKQAVIDF
jgi:hypothetical protein